MQLHTGAARRAHGPWENQPELKEGSCLSACLSLPLDLAFWSPHDATLALTRLDLRVQQPAVMVAIPLVCNVGQAWVQDQVRGGSENPGHDRGLAMPSCVLAHP